MNSYAIPKPDNKQERNLDNVTGVYTAAENGMIGFHNKGFFAVAVKVEVNIRDHDLCVMESRTIRFVV